MLDGVQRDSNREKAVNTVQLLTGSCSGLHTGSTEEYSGVQERTKDFRVDA